MFSTLKKLFGSAPAHDPLDMQQRTRALLIQNQRKQQAQAAGRPLQQRAHRPVQQQAPHKVVKQAIKNHPPRANQPRTNQPRKATLTNLNHDIF